MSGSTHRRHEVSCSEMRSPVAFPLPGSSLPLPGSVTYWVTLEEVWFRTLATTLVRSFGHHANDWDCFNIRVPARLAIHPQA
jgi:hypothetical protein